MTAVIFAIIAFLSTLTGGLVALKNQHRVNKFLAYTAGVLLGVVAFDLLPEIFDIINDEHLDAKTTMIALVCGFLLFHVVEKSILIHSNNESDYETHHHPHVGVASALALIGHSFLDGVAIGLGFHAGTAVGITVAIAVIAHDFTDGLNTVNLLLLNKNRPKRALAFLIGDAAAPVLGALSTFLFTIPDKNLAYYLSFFAGFLLYIGASEILPEAHRKNSTYLTIGLTIVGVVFMYVVTGVL
jgi:ZIP family zinc transporter